MVYHSSLNDFKGQATCGALVLPVKGKCKGPAPPCQADKTDIIDEAIDFFRANVLYRKFDHEGGADLVLCYLTAYIAECLRVFAKEKKKVDGQKKILAVSQAQNFKVPGDEGFCLPGFFSNPTSRNESDIFRQYFRQIREETAIRLLELAYDAKGDQNKWWIQFHKKKFMGITNA
jgi:actin related protein 2/3 complex subunit 3